MHAVGDVPDTAVSSLDRDRRPGVGIGVTCQLEPSQRSAKAIDLPAVVSSDPTATQLVAEGHDTPAKLQSMEVTGFALRSIDHPLPFHRSTGGGELKFVTPDPTAVHAVAEVHETAESIPTPRGIN